MCCRHVEGGMGSVSAAISNAAIEAGASIMTNAEVSQPFFKIIIKFYCYRFSILLLAVQVSQLMIGNSGTIEGVSSFLRLTKWINLEVFINKYITHYRINDLGVASWWDESSFFGCFIECNPS